MIIYRLLGVLLLIFFYLEGNAQPEKKRLEMIRCNEPPVIDGKLDDKCWNEAALMKDFIQYQPYNAELPKHKTEVKVLYDDQAIYFVAMMYDPHPDSIVRTLAKRDVGPDDNADMVIIVLGPYNDGINTNLFCVSASGVQSDIKTTSSNDDVNWDAVWKSEVRKVDSGWVAEVKIPFSELRFSKQEVQTWAGNFYRKVNRYNEWSTWSFVDYKIEGHANQTGVFSGFNNLNPPLRLSFTPYLSLFAEHNSEQNSWTRGIRGGLDLKYGISESFTLDMMVIPDFAQVQSDDKILNLSPFEVKYEEHRPFFNEGTELFSKGGLYYSKRVGGFPKEYDNVGDDLSENEIIVKNPSESQIINATKLTGRTKKGLGIGFFNAMTQKTPARIKDTLTNAERELITQPFTNYNLLVFDQTLKNNSHFSLVNSHVAIPSDDYMANVSAVDFKIKNKAQVYELNGVVALSQIYQNDTKGSIGYSHELDFEKNAGKFQFGIEQELVDKKYNPNDLGYLGYNNYIETGFYLKHKILKPTKKLVDYYSYIEMELLNRFEPFDFMDMGISSETGFTFHNYWTTGFFMGGKPFKPHNFHETRVENRFYEEPTEYYTGVFMNSDSRKKLFFRIMAMHWASFSNYGQNMKRIEIEPTMRAGDRFMLSLGTELEKVYNSIGYVSHTDDYIFFGRRHRQTISTSVKLDYGFTANMNLSCRVRHYLSSADYHGFYTLSNEGLLFDYPDYTDNEDITFNAFNVDFVFNWRFAPGSDFIFVYKNAIYHLSDLVYSGYGENLRNTFDAPKYDHFSIKLLYYIDYNYFRHKKRSGK